MNFEEALRISLRNIAEHGDTDIFPRPFETYAFFDKLQECRAKLVELHTNFEDNLASRPPSTIVTLTQVGYTGFRWAVQIEPFWNAYYLALVVALADQIESKRIPTSDKIVFSYRFGWNEQEAKLFTESSWRDYKIRALELSRNAKFVVLTDIADFYPRISHHRLENALGRLPIPGDLPSRIMELLKNFSRNVSHGLPIGGPASRILAELSLVPVDEHLFRRKIQFCRYADDYSIFCKDKSEAYNALVLLSDKLYNEDLALQKSKTRIISVAEFQELSALLGPRVYGTPQQDMTDEQKLLNISIRYDPYSFTADEDYDRLKAAVQEVDILGILSREISKTSLDPALTKQAINAIRALNQFAREGAIRMLLDGDNLEILSPVFVTLMRAVRGVYNESDSNLKDFIDDALLQLYNSRSHLLSVELNLCYFIRALSLRRSERKEEILIDLFERQSSHLIRRHIILTMGSWRCFYWLTDLRKRYSGLSDWEKRAFIAVSYVLGDEGRHWRDHAKHTWSPMDSLVRDWCSQRWQKSETVPL